MKLFKMIVVIAIAILSVGCSGKVKEGVYGSNMSDEKYFVTQKEDTIYFVELKEEDGKYYRPGKSIEDYHSTKYIKNNGRFVEYENITTELKIKRNKFLLTWNVMGQESSIEYKKQDVGEIKIDKPFGIYKYVLPQRLQSKLLDILPEVSETEDFLYILLSPRASFSDPNFDMEKSDYSQLDVVTFPANKKTVGINDLFVEWQNRISWNHETYIELDSFHFNKNSVYANPENAWDIQTTIYSSFSKVLGNMIVQHIGFKEIEGFIVYDIDDDGIAEAFDITLERVMTN